VLESETLKAQELFSAVWAGDWQNKEGKKFFTIQAV
jgi:hypothetical protein